MVVQRSTWLGRAVVLVIEQVAWLLLTKRGQPRVIRNFRSRRCEDRMTVAAAYFLTQINQIDAMGTPAGRTLLREENGH